MSCIKIKIFFIDKIERDWSEIHAKNISSIANAGVQCFL